MFRLAITGADVLFKVNASADGRVSCHCSTTLVVTSSSSVVCVGTEDAETHGTDTSKRSLPLQRTAAATSQDLTPENRLPTLAASIRHRLLKGDLDHLPAVQSRVVRIYVSSNIYGILVCSCVILKILHVGPLRGSSCPLRRFEPARVDHN